MEGLSKQQIKIIKFALNELSESLKDEQLLLEIHKIIYVLENQNKMDKIKNPALLN